MTRVLLLTGPLLFAIAGVAAAQQNPPDSGPDMNHLVPGDSRRGSLVFRDKGCSTCHQVRGGPSGPAPTLPKRQEEPLTEGEIAARLWNHGPVMWDSIRERGRPAVRISSDEMSDLFAFLFELSLIDPPGDAGLGELLFRYKGCGDCHEPNADAANSGPTAPGIQYWGAHTSPLQLARAMWNHGEDMWSYIDDRGRSWPRLDGPELSHIVAYVRRINTIATPGHFTMGSPVDGRAVFINKGCAGCHAAAGESGHVAPGISEIGRRSTTLAGLAARMWSHYPDMVASLDEQTARRLHMTDSEMADVIAYLFAIGYLESNGDPTRGRTVFSSKLCSYCHAGQDPMGIELTRFRERVTPAEFACAMWNHGPRMAEWMRKKSIAWPELDRQAIVDLLSYLSEPE